MKLINFPGLNCYTNGIVSIINDLGLDYSTVFSSLWSETDFYYQPSREVYLSKRFPDTLPVLGLKFIMQLCESPEVTDERLSELCEGELIILGMDAFYVPWSQFFNTFHGPHFFIARYTNCDNILCYDPTFRKTDVSLTRDDIVSHAYDVSRIISVEKMPSQADALYDANEVLRTHPDTRGMVLSEIDRAENDEPSSTVLLAKYADALMNNRYLYKHYLEKLPPPYDEKHIHLTKDILSKWGALKTSLYKVAITRNNGMFNEVRKLFCELVDDEMRAANMMLG